MGSVAPGAQAGLAGTCTACGGRMIEYADATDGDVRTVQFECQSDDCSATGRLQYAYDGPGGIDDHLPSDEEFQWGVWELVGLLAAVVIFVRDRLRGLWQVIR